MRASSNARDVKPGVPGYHQGEHGRREPRCGLGLPPDGGGLMVALRTVYAWELRKLVHQKRTYLGLAVAVAVPIIFVVALALQAGQPDDVAFGRYVRQSGLAIPPVILIFGAYWLFPLITALVAGDIVAAEDHNGTLKTILTRSSGRGRIFAAKALAAFTYAGGALVLMGLTAILAGRPQVGLQPARHALGQHGLRRPRARAHRSQPRHLRAAADRGGVDRAAAFHGDPQLRRRGRRGAAHLAAAAAADDPAGPGRPAAVPPADQFNAWQGLLRDPIDWSPVVRAAWVCSLYAVPCLGAAYASFTRRDVTGG